MIEAGSGHVIAVFKNSLYLRSHLDDSSLACIGTSELVRGPINISTSYKHLPLTAVNVPWCSDRRKLQIEGLEDIEFSIDTECHTRSQSAINWPQRHTVRQLLEQYTPKHAVHLTGRHLQQGIDALGQWLQSGINDRPDQLRPLLGCGTGLTPSGDDILIGALIALDYLGHAQTFRALVDWIHSEAPTATNHISLAHLNAACQAMAIEPLHNFVAALYTDTSVTRSTIKQLENYGHQSGLDALCGVLTVTTALHPDNRAEACRRSSKIHHRCSLSAAKLS